MAAPTGKRFLFQLLSEEASDSGVLVPYAERLPMPARTNDSFVDGEAKTQREHMQKAINLMWRYPKVISQTLSHIEGLVSQSKKVAGAGCFQNVSVLRALDDDWASMFICNNSKMTEGQMESAMRFDPDTTRQIMQFCLKASGTLRFPKQCKEKAVLAKALKKRMSDVGDRLGAFEGQKLIVAATGGVNWLEMGAYQVQWDKAGRATKLVHRPTLTEVSVPSYIHVDRSFTLESNWCDYTAALVKPPAVRIVCADLFPQKEGPHISAMISGASKVFDGIVGEVATARAQEQRQAAQSSGEGSKPMRLRQKTKEDNRKEGIQKARKALAAKHDDLKRKRTVKFD